MVLALVLVLLLHQVILFFHSEFSEISVLSMLLAQFLSLYLLTGILVTMQAFLMDFTVPSAGITMLLT